MGTTAPINRHLPALRHIVGDRNLLDRETATSPYLRDWSGDYVSSPLCVVLPATTAEVSSVLAYCNAQGLVAVPQGGNTGLVGGCHATGTRMSSSTFAA